MPDAMTVEARSQAVSPVERAAPTQLNWWPYTAIFIVIAIGMGSVAFRRKTSEWNHVYCVAAMKLLTGGDIYFWKDEFVYPPVGALLALPFSYLPARFSRLGFYI